MSNHCTYDQSLALKELGFDMPVRDCYIDDKRFFKDVRRIDGVLTDNWNLYERRTSAPTRTEVLEWAREKKDIFAVVLPDDDWNSWHFYILGRDCMSPFFEMYASLNDDLEYPTHPEAETALVDKIIEILKEQKG